MSPGTVLYYKMLEDLFRHRCPRLVSFGVGINPHKVTFSNRSTFDSSIYVMRPTLRNRVRMATLGVFFAVLKLSKRLFKKGSPVEKPATPNPKRGEPRATAAITIAGLSTRHATLTSPNRSTIIGPTLDA